MEVQSATGAATIALLIGLASQTGCGTARSAGRGAAEGAIGTLAGKVGDREGLKELTEGMKRRALGGAVAELNRPEQLEGIQRIAEALAAGAVHGGSAAALGGPELVDHDDQGMALQTRGATPVEAIAAQAARAFSQRLAAELGRTGEGPLATSLSGTSEQVSASMVRGAQGELVALFPECRGVDASKCMDRAVERVSRATSAGVAAGIRESLGAWPLAFAFGAGALFTLALAWAWAIYRARRAAPLS